MPPLQRIALAVVCGLAPLPAAAAEGPPTPAATGYTIRMGGNLLAKLNTSFEAGLRNAAADVRNDHGGGRVVEGDGAFGSRCLELRAGDTFCSEMLPVQPGRYRLALSLRGVDGGVPLLATVMTSYQQQGLKRPVYGRLTVGRPAGEWRREEAEIVIPASGPGQVALMISAGPARPMPSPDADGEEATAGGGHGDGAVRIDGITLTAASAPADWQPPGPVEMGLSSPATFAAVEDGQAMPLRLALANPGDRPCEVAVSLALHDLMGGRRDEALGTWRLAPGERRDRALDLAHLPVGQHVAILAASAGGERVTANLVLSVLPLHPGFAPDPQGPFLGRIEPGPGGAAIAADLGWASSRLHGPEYGIWWNQVEPTPGGFTFAIADRALAALPPGLPLAGLLNFPARSGPPAWAERVIPPPGAWKKSKPLARDDALWARYVSTTVAHFRGRITTWEVHNEPNGIMAASAYLPQLKAAYQAAKQADPSVTVLGFCSTLDQSPENHAAGDMLPFMRECLEAGAGAFCDGISFHPYVWPKSPEDGHLRDAVRQIAALRDRYAPGKALWNTEYGWTSAVLRPDRPRTEAGPNNNLDSGAVHPLETAAWCVRSHAIQLALGVSRIQFFNKADPNAVLPFRAAAISQFDYDGSLLPVYLAYREVIHRLTGRSFAEERVAADEGACVQRYRSNRGGDDLVLLWSLRPHPLALPAQAVRVHDLLGRDITPMDGRRTLAARPTPVYITAPPAAGTALVGLLADALGIRQPAGATP